VLGLAVLQLVSSSRLPVEMHRGHPGVHSKQKAKGYSRCLPESLILVVDRLSLSRNLNEVSFTGTHSRVEIDIRILTNQETEDQEEEGVGLNEMKVP